MSDWDKRFDGQEAKFPFGYLKEHVNDWDAFCEDTGLNPWLLNEGLAESSDTYSVKIGLLRKHGVLP